MLRNVQKYCLVILLLILVQSIFAQNVSFEKSNFKDNKKLFKGAMKDIKAGDELLEISPGLSKAALDYYLSANELNPNSAQLNYKIGYCYLNTIFKIFSIHFLEKAFRLDPNVDKKIHYYLGQAYHLNLDFEKAIEEFNKYKGSLTPQEWEETSKDVIKRIAECKTGIELVKTPVRVFIDNIGSIVNSPFPDYSPLISADESVMIFTSRRDNTTGGEKSEYDYEYFEDVYITYNTNGNWTMPKNMGKPINTETHDATVGFAPDAQKLFIYRDDNEGDIFACKLKGEEWSKPKALPKTINTKYHESSASFSFDGKTIYFVSNKPGGYGGRDVYKSTLGKKDKWGKAKNLGAVINTPYDEEGIFMQPDGKTLYFSSKGHATMGGHDIFKSVMVDGKWTEPENLGYPVNTPDDDVYFVISASGKHGYYASAKKGGVGEKDIYMITFLGPEKPLVLNTEDNLLASITTTISEALIEPVVEVKTSSITILKGVVQDAVTQKVLEAEIEIVDNDIGEVIASFASNSKTGKYLITLPSGKNYGIAVKAEGYLFHSENFDIKLSTEYQEIIKNVDLKRIAVGSNIVLRNIFFDFDKATLRPESKAELLRLIKLLNDVSSMRIEISGHTDSRGSDEYNEKLSHSRAKSVVDYLIKEGIKSSRLEYKGYGESQPLATNDTEEGRQFNRRTEFKILSK